MPNQTDYLDIQEAFSGEDAEQLFRDTWLNNGEYAPTGQAFEMKDMLAVSNARHWLPRVVNEVVREPVEPLMVLTSLLDRVQFSGAQQITFPTLGAIRAADVAEGQAYPERTLQIGPGTTVVQSGKSGLAFKITEEMLRYSQFDVVNLHLRAARRALDRWKEFKAARYITSMGTSIFDNKNPTTSIYGTCTGRSIVGAGNGSFTMDDLMKAYAFIMMQGFTPDTILLHPLTWSMWMADPLLRTILKNTGNGTWFAPHQMPKTVNPWKAASLGGRTTSGGQSFTPGQNAGSETATGVKAIDQNLQSAPQVPSYFPHPLRVLVSPFMPFDVTNQTADIFILDSNNFGALVEDEPVMVDEWDDPSVDIKKIKLRERYNYVIYEDGLSVGVVKNVPVKANEIAFPVQPTISVAGSISELDQTVAIPGL